MKLTIEAEGNTKMAIQQQTFSVSRPPASVTMTTLTGLELQAEAGDARAQFRLGEIYEEGRGVTPDAERAVACYRRAAQQNNVEAQLALGVLYALGETVVRDFSQAFVWFTQAAAQGHEEALTLRGLVLRELDAVARERAEVEAWRQQAAL